MTDVIRTAEGVAYGSRKKPIGEALEVLAARYSLKLTITSYRRGWFKHTYEFEVSGTEANLNSFTRAMEDYV